MSCLRKLLRRFIDWLLPAVPPFDQVLVLAALVALTGCGGGSLPKVGDACGCDQRGINTWDAQGDQLVCMRIVQQFPDGGVEYPDCRGGICCAWGRP